VSSQLQSKVCTLLCENIRVNKAFYLMHVHLTSPHIHIVPPVSIKWNTEKRMPLLAMTEVTVHEILCCVCRCRGISYVLWLICHFTKNLFLLANRLGNMVLLIKWLLDLILSLPILPFWCEIDAFFFITYTGSLEFGLRDCMACSVSKPCWLPHIRHSRNLTSWHYLQTSCMGKIGSTVRLLPGELQIQF